MPLPLRVSDIFWPNFSHITCNEAEPSVQILRKYTAHIFYHFSPAFRGPYYSVTLIIFYQGGFDGFFAYVLWTPSHHRKLWSHWSESICHKQHCMKEESFGLVNLRLSSVKCWTVLLTWSSINTKSSNSVISMLYLSKIISHSFNFKEK